MRRRLVSIALVFGFISGLLVIPTILNTDRGIWLPTALIMGVIWMGVVIGAALVGARIDRDQAALDAAEGPGEPPSSAA